MSAYNWEWLISGVIGGMALGLLIAICLLYWALKDTWRR